MSILKLNLIVVAVVFGLTAGFVFGLLVPGLEKLEARRETLAGKVAKVQTKQQEVGAVSGLYATILEMDKRMRDFREQLPAQQRFGEFVNDLCESLEACGIHDYFPQQRPAIRLDEDKLDGELALASGTVILPVRVSFETTTASLFEFLKKMEEMPRLSHLESMKLVNRETDPGRISVELVLHTYQHPE